MFPDQTAINSQEPQVQTQVQLQVEPQVQQPIVQEPQVQQPIVQEPQVQEPQVQQPIVQEPQVIEQVQQPILQETQVIEQVQQPIVQEQVQQSPLTEISSFKPEIQETNKLLTSISPAKFDGLLKVLALLSDSSDPIVISNSTITKNLSSGAIIYTDVKDVFDGQQLDLHVVNPRKNIKLFKQFKNNNNIFVSEDNSNSRYIVENGEIKLFLPKQDEAVNEFKTEMPSLEGVKVLAQLTINKTIQTIISELSRDSEYIEYLFQNSVLKAVHIPETAIYIFEDFIGDKEASKLDETNASLALRSTSFLPIAAEEYELNIGKLPDGSFCSYTICNTGYIKINVFEELEDTTGGSIF